jgi:UPF0716 protein FxsA
MPVLALLALYTFAEIAAFIAVGRAIGVPATLALVAVAMAAGLLVIRVLGLDALRRAEASLSRGESPAGAVFDAACVALAGILLALPGFLSDLLALALLVRPLRKWLGGLMWRGLQASPNVRVWRDSSGMTVVEGEYVEIREQRVLPPGPRGPGSGAAR